MAKLHVKKGDNVLVIAGKDKGKIGKILSVNPSDSTVVVEGVNIITKHKKARSAQDKGGIIKQEGKIHSSNVQVIDPTTKRPTRIAHKIVDGKKVRVSKHSDTVLDAKIALKKVKKSAEKAEKPVKAETVKQTEKKETAAKAAPKAAAEKPAAKKAATATKATATKTATKATATKTAAKATEAKPAAKAAPKSTVAKAATATKAAGAKTTTVRKQGR